MKFLIHPEGPFRLDLTALALRRRTNNLIDQWDGREYRRVIIVRDVPFEVRVRQSGQADEPSLRVEATEAKTHKLQPAEIRKGVSAALEKLLGLRRDLSDFYSMARSDRRLGPLVAELRGLKPPRFPSVFECLLNAISCQQLSLIVGIYLMNRLARAFGPAGPDGDMHALPRAADLTGVKPDALRRMGYSLAKAKNILALAKIAADEPDRLEGMEGLDDAAALDRLHGLPGVGPWTAEYALLRGLGRLNVIPLGDVGFQDKLHRWLGLKARPDSQQVKKLVERWRPFAGMIYFHLLLEHIRRVQDLAGMQGIQGIRIR